MSDDVLPQQSMSLTIEQALQQAIAHHQAGALQDAERLYRAILQAQPNHSDANHNLGVLAVQVKQAANGLQYFKAALEVNRNQEQYWVSYIDALIQSGQTDAARQMLDQARQSVLQGVAVEALAERLKDDVTALNQSDVLHTTKDSPPATSTTPRKKKTEAKHVKLTKLAREPVSRGKGNPAPQEISALDALFKKEQFLEAARLAQTLTVRFPHHGVSWKAYGLALSGMGRFDEALIPLQKAVALLPKDAETYRNLGVVLRYLGRLDDATTSYRQALQINPNYADAHNSLGNALKELGQLDAAVNSYRQALKINPDFAEAYSNLGNALKDLRQLDAAVDSYRQALKISPDFAEAHNNLGAALKDLGQLDAAVVSYRQALKIKPDYAQAHCNLGVVLQNQAKLDAAVASYRQAMKIKPDFAEAYSNLGAVLQVLGQFDAAEASYRQALKIKPDFAEAYSNLGAVLQILGQLQAALACCREALKINPDLSDAHSNLLFIHNYLADQSPSVMLDEARRFGDLAARLSRPYTTWHNALDPDRSLRVGLVSADLRLHPVGFFVESVLEALALNAASRIEIIVYFNHPLGDALTDRVRAFCHKWHSSVGLSDERLAHQIREDGIDVLIDLSGHTAHNRLPMFAWKPAPIQVSWLGYFATTGVAAMDYLIADPWTLPVSEEINFTETIWRLPETRLCFTPPDVTIDVSPAPSLGNRYITFGCFNNLTKMNDAVVSLWAKVLLAVPDSRLFLKAKQLTEASQQVEIQQRFAAHGIAADRLMLDGTDARTEYLAAYHRVDIALDPFPFPGGTTSVEGLWMGVPVLTLAGQSFLSWQGVGIMINAGLSDWIASDTNDYVAKAVAHASDLPRLAILRSGLRQQVLASPLFDAPRFARHFEEALWGMWNRLLAPTQI